MSGVWVRGSFLSWTFCFWKPRFLEFLLLGFSAENRVSFNSDIQSRLPGTAAVISCAKQPKQRAAVLCQSWGFQLQFKSANACSTPSSHPPSNLVLVIKCSNFQGEIIYRSSFCLASSVLVDISYQNQHELWKFHYSEMCIPLGLCCQC